MNVIVVRVGMCFGSRKMPKQNMAHLVRLYDGILDSSNRVSMKKVGSIAPSQFQSKTLMFVIAQTCVPAPAILQALA